jgi:hypothetical protein
MARKKGDRAGVTAKKKTGMTSSLRPKVRPMTSSLRPKSRPEEDTDAIERGNRAAKRTAQDLATMEAGGLVGGQKKLDKNKDGKISGADFKMMKKGGKVKKMMGGGQVCRGGGAAISGTNFSGVK